LNQLDYHIWGAMLEKYQKLQPKLKTIGGLKVYEELPQEHMNKAVANFTKRLTAAHDGHFESISKFVSSSQHQNQEDSK